MHVVEVTPLIKGTQLERLSYFSPTPYPVGSFVTVPIRGKTQSAIVIDARPVTSDKTALKAANFSLRKLPHQGEAPILPHTLQETARSLSSVYPASTGALLFALLPPDVRQGRHPYPLTTERTRTEDSTPQVLTARVDERFVTYQTQVRSSFAQQGSVLFVVPTAADIDFAKTTLGHGISDRIVVFSGAQTKRQRERSYAKLIDGTQPLLIITTPAFAYLERGDINLIIVEQCASGHYVGRYRPYLDHRTALKHYAAVSHRGIILGDIVPRTEEEVARREDRHFTSGEEVRRIAFTAPLSIITQRDKPRPEAMFQLFSTELVTSVERALEAKGHVFFFAARRGLAPIVACLDCGLIFRCPDSNTPYSLLRTYEDGVERRWFVSSTSGRKVPAADVCTHCGSWRLRERGIGIQHVFDEWKDLAPAHPTHVLDQTTASTPRQAAKIAKEFYAEPGSVLIGTQAALPFLSPGVDVSAIISLDAARSIPTWRADETLFRLLLRLRECTAKEVVVQTRSEPDPLLIHATRGAIERFYDDEISLRQMASYPPFSTFILLTWSSSRSNIEKLSQSVTLALGDIPHQSYQNPNSTTQKSIRHVLIRADRDDQAAYERILTTLRALPPYVKVEIDPERIV